MMRPIRALASMSVMMCLASPAHAVVDKYDVTPAEHAACDMDAASLCSAAYPDEDKLVACMRAKFTQLSQACSAVFTAGLKKRHMHL